MKKDKINIIAPILLGAVTAGVHFFRKAQRVKK